MTTTKQSWGDSFNQFRTSIGTKIILPYLLLTLGVAAVGAFIIVRLVSSSWQERFNNQLLDTGRVVSESMVDFEAQRLETLRAVVATNGVPESLMANDRAGLAERVPQIIINSSSDAVELIDLDGQEVYGWQRPPNQAGDVGEERVGADYSQLPEVQRVLNGEVDDFGPKQVLLTQTPYGLMLFTIAPVLQEEQIVGAAMVGFYLEEMVRTLAEIALTRVTLYDAQGNVIETSFGDVSDLIQESPNRYQAVLSLLHESSDRYPVVVTGADSEVPLRRVQILNQEYALAYGDWRVRGKSLGFFSVALPTTFIVNTTSTSRTRLTILFIIATIAVFMLGYFVAQLIIRPLQRLVQTSVAVTEGDLSRRSGITGQDEIGSLAQSFDTMTERLVNRNRLLLEQATKLEAILDSTADGIIVVDQQGVIISSNPAAQQILTEVSSDFLTDILRNLPPASAYKGEHGAEGVALALKLAGFQHAQRYTVSDRVLSALMAPMKTPQGEVLGIVIAMRDITREAEAEQLKDSFITNISHELRTPLTAIMGNGQLLELTGQDSLSAQHQGYIQAINQNANKLFRHINEIIEISLLQSGSLRLEKMTMSFLEMLEEGLEEWREQLEEKGFSFEIILPDHDVMIEGDPDRLSWAINNLLENSYNYTLSGGVKVVLAQVEHEAHLEVIDTGVGISPEDQAYLFTRFFRATPHKDLYQVAGVGLGLFVTRSIVEAHHGRVWATSEVDVGSTFSLALPLSDQEASIIINDS